MGVADILSTIDREIALLEQVRAMLNGNSTTRPERNGGRTKAGAHTNGSGANPVRKKRRLTPEGRRRIAEAVRRRWETHRKAAAAKSARSTAK